MPPLRTALLLNPPFDRPVFRDHYCASEAKSAYLWHPLDLLIQAAWLARAGFAIHAVDAIALPQKLASIRQAVKSRQPALAVVLVAERTWPADQQCLKLLREAGVPAVAAAGDFLRFGTGPVDEAAGLVDLVITDFTTPHLAASLAGGRPAGPGIATIDEVKARRFNAFGRAPLEFPPLDQRLFHPARYRLPYPGFSGIASILASYGCPFRCQYCHVGELDWRLRPAAEIVADLAAARAAGCKSIYFRDATINAHRAHLLEWLKLMDARGLASPWAAFATAEPFDDEIASWMARTGCRHLQLGVETWNDQLRRRQDKPLTSAAHEECIKLCHHHGIEVTGHFMLGLPGETPQIVEETIQRIAESDLDYVAINIAESRPGAPARERGEVFPAAPGASPAGAGNVEELKCRRAAAYRKFYLRPRRMFKELTARARHRDLGGVLALAREAARWVPRR